MFSEARLRDGTQAIIVDLEPRDRDAVREGFEALSPETRRHRFLSDVPRMTETLLRHLVDEVDGVDHVAVALAVLDDDHRGEPAGIGRMVRYPDRPTVADVAVTVFDEFQGRGIATALVQELLRRRPEGVTRVDTVVMEDNAPSLAMLRHLGPLTVTGHGTGTLRVVVDLPAPEE